ncbi:hypothetical protein BH23CHL2_BH23CHL2_34700 [soil metagenome]
MIKRVALILVVFATILGLVFLADVGLLVGLLDTLSASSLALLVGIFIAGAILKGFRWAFYLRSARLNIRWRDGMTSFLAGMSTSPLPGGSWLAPRLAQEHGCVRMRQAAPALFVSFIVDAITVPTLVLILFLATDQSRYSIAIPVIGITLGLVLLAMGRSFRVWSVVAQALSRFRFTRSWLPKERDVQARVQALLRPRVLLGGIAFSVGATILSAAFLLVLVNALTIFSKISLEEAIWVHTVSETAGIAIPIPGGFGVTDSSIAGLLNQSGIGLGRATFLALALRSSEAVFRVFFGTVVLFVRYDQFLLSALDVPRRTRGAYRHACKVPGVRAIFEPLAKHLRPQNRPLTPAPIEGPSSDEISLAD